MGGKRDGKRGGWEEDLASVIDKSNRDLGKVYSEAQSKRGRPLHPRPVPYHPPFEEDDGGRIFRDVVNVIDNGGPACGPHQKAAIQAFHAARNGTRPLSRGRATEAEEARRAEARINRGVDDKLVGTSHAIDALRDQLSVLADEVRQLNRSSSTQERQVNALQREFDTRRGAVDGLEAHMADEVEWRKSVGSEMGRLKQTIAEQRGDIAARATLAEVKTGLESTRQSSAMSIDAVVSPMQVSMKKEMQAVMREVSALRESLPSGLEQQMQQVSDRIESSQRKVVQTMEQAVKQRAALTERKCIKMMEGMEKRCMEAVEERIATISVPDRSDKQCIKMITKVVTAAAVKIEANLRRDLLAKIEKEVAGKVEENRQQEVQLIDRHVRESMEQETQPIKELLDDTAAKLTHCLTKTKADAMIESCRAQCDENLSLLEKRLLAKLSGSDKEVLKAMQVSLSTHDAWLEQLREDNAGVSNRLRQVIARDEVAKVVDDRVRDQMDNFVLKEEVKAIADKGADRFERCMKLIRDIDNTTKKERSEIKIPPTRDPDWSQHFVTRDDVLSIADNTSKVRYEVCRELIKDIEQKAQSTRDLVADRVREQFDQCTKLIRNMEHATDNKISAQVAECRAQIRDSCDPQQNNFITKEDAEAIAESKSKMYYEICRGLIEGVEAKAHPRSCEKSSFVTKDELEQWAQSTNVLGDNQVDEIKSELMEVLGNKLQDYASEDKCKAQFDRCARIIRDNERSTNTRMTSVESTLNDLSRFSDRAQSFVTMDEAVGIAENRAKVQFEGCLSQMKEMESIMKQHMSDYNFFTKEDVRILVEEEGKDRFERCQELIKESDCALHRKMESQVDECKSLLSRDISNQSAECKSYASRVSDIEVDFGSKMTRLLDVVESFDERFHDAEDRSAALEEDLTCKFDDKTTEIGRLIHSMDERLKSKIVDLQDEMGEFQQRLSQGSYADAKVSANESSCDDVTKESGLQGVKADIRGSNSSRNMLSIEQTTRAAEVPTSHSELHPFDPPMTEVEVARSPVVGNGSEETATPSSIVHLLGLGSPGSIDGSGQTDSIEPPEENVGGVEDNCGEADDDGGYERTDLIRERNTTLSHVARTLSYVGRKREDPSLRRLAADVRAGKIRREPSDEESANAGPLGSDGGSIDTAEALSLCGIVLDESDGGNDNDNGHGDGDDGISDDDDVQRQTREAGPKLPTAGSIGTAGDMALRDVREMADPDGESQALSKGDDSRSERLSEGDGDENDTHNDNDTMPFLRERRGETEEDDDGTASPSRRRSGTDSTASLRQGRPSALSPSSTYVEPGSCSEEHDRGSPLRQESLEEDDDLSLPGSISSYDEIVECSPQRGEFTSPGLTSSWYNPTRTTNPDPYEGWDALLTELRASGRILRDRGDGGSAASARKDDEEASSYGSEGFESEDSEIT